MPTAFAITAASTTFRLEAGEVPFTVTNTSGRPLRARLRAAALQPEAQGWFTVVGETERLLVPASAIVRRSELTAVYVVGGDAVTLRQIRSGRRYGERIEVLAGLDAGEIVAADPVAAGVYLQQRRLAQ